MRYQIFDNFFSIADFELNELKIVQIIMKFFSFSKKIKSSFFSPQNLTACCQTADQSTQQ